MQEKGEADEARERALKDIRAAAAAEADADVARARAEAMRAQALHRLALAEHMRAGGLGQSSQLLASGADTVRESHSVSRVYKLCVGRIMALTSGVYTVHLISA